MNNEHQRARDDDGMQVLTVVEKPDGIFEVHIARSTSG